MKPDENFDGRVWFDHLMWRAEDLQVMRDAALRHRLTHSGVGLLHEPSPPAQRAEARATRRHLRRVRLRLWWYRVRAPLRRLGGCIEEG